MTVAKGQVGAPLLAARWQEDCGWPLKAVGKGKEGTVPSALQPTPDFSPVRPSRASASSTETAVVVGKPQFAAFVTECRRGIHLLFHVCQTSGVTSSARPTDAPGKLRPLRTLPAAVRVPQVLLKSPKNC